jgi:hypothetical protein
VCTDSKKNTTICSVRHNRFFKIQVHLNLCHRGPGSIPGQSLQGVCCTKWHSDRFDSEYFCFSLSVSFHRCSISLPSTRSSYKQDKRTKVVNLGSTGQNTAFSKCLMGLNTSVHYLNVSCTAGRMLQCSGWHSCFVYSYNCCSDLCPLRSTLTTSLRHSVRSIGSISKRTMSQLFPSTYLQILHSYNDSTVRNYIHIILNDKCRYPLPVGSINLQNFAWQ